MTGGAHARGLALAIGMVVATGAVADEYAVAPDSRSRIEAVVGKTGAKVNYFPGPGGTIGVGLTMANGRQMVVYATDDGRALFSGAAIDTATGENVTRRDLQTRMPKPDYSGLKDAVRKAHAIEWGTAPADAEFFVFVDPFCPYCHKAFEAFEQLAAEGGAFKVHWIPLGILGPKSENAAKGLLGAPAAGREAALKAVMTAAVSTATPGDIAAGNRHHQDNLAIFRNFQFSAVPVVVTVRGATVEVSQGLPQLADLRSVLAPQTVAQR
jgi:thiol:disulfide interchange protein DsbG